MRTVVPVCVPCAIFVLLSTLAGSLHVGESRCIFSVAKGGPSVLSTMHTDVQHRNMDIGDGVRLTHPYKLEALHASHWTRVFHPRRGSDGFSHPSPVVPG